MSPIQKQGYLGDISSKSTTELMDLLSRQDKILRKTKFVESLPDKGAKVRAFYEKLQQLILERNPDMDISDYSDITSAAKPVSQHQADIITDVIENKQKQSETDCFSPETVEYVTNVGMDMKGKEQNQTEALITNSDINSSQRNNGSEVEMDTVSVTTESNNPINVKDSNLEESLKNMKISGEVSAMDRVEREKTTNAYSKALQNASEIHIPLKPNNNLKKTRVSDLPREYKFKSRDKDRISPVSPQVVEESAATPPNYKHKESKLISINESLNLQIEQKVKQEELQARHAAEKLSQRLGVKMDAYNPEGVDMSYRNQEEEEVDSDDELE